MEGPSLYLAQEQLKPFRKQRILSVEGNTTIAKDRFEGQVVKDIFSWGKHLVFQFNDFALRVHFLLFGTFEAVVKEVAVTGDYRRARVPRLKFTFKNGEIAMFNCSVKFIEDADAKKLYDLSVDIMSAEWDPAKALKQFKAHADEQIADVLLDQDVFAGVGNIIKNEVLSLTRTHPEAKVSDLTPRKRKEIVATARSFSQQFLAWRRAFVLRKNLQAHGRGTCPHCGRKLVKRKTGKRVRWAYYCEHCQPLKKDRSSK
jgi:endonuclease VIII